MKKVLALVMVLGICSVAMGQLPPPKLMPEDLGRTTVDGNLGDWAAGDTPWLVLGAGNPDGGLTWGASTDQSNAKYAVRWDAGGIYFALQVDDSAQVFNPAQPNWNNPDHIELFTDFTNGNFAGYAYGGTSGAFSDAQQTMLEQADGLGGVWFGSGFPFVAPVAPVVGVSTIVGNTYNYEAYISSIDGTLAAFPLAIGMTVGADAAAVSWNGTTYSFLQANNVGGKFANAVAFQDWILVPGIPEPITMVMLGLGGVALIRRKK